MKKNDFDLLYGRAKNEVLTDLGDGFNFYPDKIWYYIISEKWWGKKTVLFIEFDEQDVVITKYIKTVFGKIKTDKK